MATSASGTDTKRKTRSTSGTDTKPKTSSTSGTDTKPKTGPKSKKPKCGLCGNSKKELTKTPCCDNWICDDEHTYVMFSFARNSCDRNHRRYTLCAYHYNEGHQGSWQDCKKCKDSFDTPNYVHMGTNEYNFEVLQNPEKYSITCVNCGTSADTLDAFPIWSSATGYYCAKKKCQKAGYPHPH